MNEELEQLQKIGAQRIYEETHIPLLTVQALLHSSYDGFTRVQFLGFVSILEREYHIELKSIKTAGLTHFDAEKEEEGVFVVPKRAPKKTYLFVGLLILFLLGIAYQVFVIEKTIDVKIEDSSKVEKVKKSIIPLIEIEQKSTSVSVEKNVTTLPELREEPKKIEEPKKVEALVPASLKITSKSKVWFGYIDVKTNKKYQKTFRGTQELDAKKSWLFMFGHGYINISINGKVQKFTSPNTVYFLYENAELKSINAREFKRLNRGNKW